MRFRFCGRPATLTVSREGSSPVSAALPADIGLCPTPRRRPPPTATRPKDFSLTTAPASRRGSLPATQQSSAVMALTGSPMLLRCTRPSAPLVQRSTPPRGRSVAESSNRSPTRASLRFAASAAGSPEPIATEAAQKSEQLGFKKREEESKAAGEPPDTPKHAPLSRLCRRSPRSPLALGTGRANNLRLQDASPCSPCPGGPLLKLTCGDVSTPQASFRGGRRAAATRLLPRAR